MDGDERVGHPLAAGLVLDLDGRPEAHDVAAGHLDHPRVHQPVAQLDDLRLKARLRVLGLVVLGVLLEVAEPARGLDLLGDGRARRPLEVGRAALAEIRRVEDAAPPPADGR